LSNVFDMLLCSLALTVWGRKQRKRKRNRKCDFSFRGVCVYPCNGGRVGTCTRVLQVLSELSTYLFRL